MHPRPYHLPAIFGSGPREPMPPARLAIWRAMVRNDRKPGRLSVAAVQVGLTLADMLGADGTLCPAHSHLAARVQVHVSTVTRALQRLRSCGFVTWTRRLVRNGWRVEQTSNQYQLRVPEVPLSDAEEKKSIGKLSRAFCQSQSVAQPPTRIRFRRPSPFDCS